MKTRLNSFLLGLPVAISFLLASNVQAQLLVNESFNYTSGQGLSGQNGGTGFSGAWIATSSDQIQSGSLTDGNLSTSGNSFVTTGTVNTGNTTRSLPSSLAGTGNDVWVGFEIERTSTSPSYGGLVLGSGATTVGTVTGTKGIFLGFSGGDLGVGPDGSSPSASTGTAFSANTVEYYVADLDYTTATSGTITVYLNATPGGALGTDFTSLNFSLANFSSIGIEAQSGTVLDEISIGDSYASISAPEPTTASLFAFSAMAGLFLIFHRRKGLRSLS